MILSVLFGGESRPGVPIEECDLLLYKGMEPPPTGVSLTDDNPNVAIGSEHFARQNAHQAQTPGSFYVTDERGDSTAAELREAAKLSLEIIGTAGFDGYFKRVNAAAEKILGYSRDELLSKPFIDFVHADDRSSTIEATAALTAGAHVAHFQNRYRCKDGSYRWLQWQSKSSLAEKIIYFAARDVTEQKEAADKFRRQEEQYRLLFETNPSPMWVYDTETLSFLAVNDAAVRRYGYSREEFLSLKLTDIRPAEEVASLLTAISDPAAPPRHGGEWQHRTKDGDLLLVEIYSSPVIFEDRPARMATAIDITERKRAEERLQEQADMLNRAHDAIIVRNFDDRRIVFWNSGAERLYGWSAEQAIGQQIDSLILSDPGQIEPISQVLLSTGEYRGELKEITKERRELTVEVWSTLVRNDDGSPRSVLSINNDITEQKKLETQLLRAQRLESIGTLASGVAHDLNNILTPILICTEILRDRPSLEDASSTISLIEESARRGAGIVKQVLTFARGVEGERVLINPGHLIDEMIDIARKTFPKSIDINGRYPEELWSIEGDPTQLHQVLLNLSVNARDAMRDGGQLTVAAENFQVDEHYASMTASGKAGPYVLFQVIDSGNGMPRAMIDKIFDPFFTTKELGKGTGLGLSTVMGIVKSHGGFISVYSEIGNGTTFKVFLPAKPSEATPVKSEIPAESLNGNGEIILIADDEPIILRTIKMILEKRNYRVLTASDGPEALARFAQETEPIAVVLTDISMPFMDGVSVIRAINKMKPGTRFIASTGQGEETRVSELKSLGVETFLTKPYDAEKLLKTLRERLS